MSEYSPERTIDYAQYLLTLDETQRKQAGKALNGALLAGMPDDEVGKPPVRKLGEYLDWEIPYPPMLIEPGLVARGAITAMTARGGKGKTTLALNRLIRWSMGQPLFHELPEVPLTPRDGEAQILSPVKQDGRDGLRVLIIENEGAPGHFQLMLQTIITGGERDADGRVTTPFYTPEEIALARENVHIWGDGGWSRMKMDSPENHALVQRAVSEVQPDILFMEPFRGLWSGEENDSTAMANVLDNLSEIAMVGECAVMLTHHEKKGYDNAEDAMSAARGSTALEGHAAVMERYVPARGDKQRELSWPKTRFAERQAPVRMEFDRRNWAYTYVAEADVKRAIKQFLMQFPDQYLGKAEIAEELDEKQPKIAKPLKELVDDGEIKARPGMDGQGNKMGYAYHQSADDEDALAIT